MLLRTRGAGFHAHGSAWAWKLGMGMATQSSGHGTQSFLQCHNQSFVKRRKTDFSRHLRHFHLSVRQNSSTNRHGRDDTDFGALRSRSAPFLHLFEKSIFALLVCVQVRGSRRETTQWVDREMTDKQGESRGDFSAARVDNRVISDRVQELTWALLDEQINDDEFILLDNLLLSDEKARSSYIGCVQLHTDLMAHFAVPTGKAGATGAGSPVLGFLNADSPLGFQSPAAKDATP
jgi:hypothetical protein